MQTTHETWQPLPRNTGLLSKARGKLLNGGVIVLGLMKLGLLWFLLILCTVFVLG